MIANIHRRVLTLYIRQYRGDRTVAGLDRFRRLRAVLRNVYLREHAVTLERLADAGKRDAKKYIDSLDGMVPYVAARVLLLCFDVHGVPVSTQVPAIRKKGCRGPTSNPQSFMLPPPLGTHRSVPARSRE